MLPTAWQKYILEDTTYREYIFFLENMKIMKCIEYIVLQSNHLV